MLSKASYNPIFPIALVKTRESYYSSFTHTKTKHLLIKQSSQHESDM